MSEVGRVGPKARWSALAPAPIDWQMWSTIHRLVAALDGELAGRMIGPALRRELLFHALRGTRGPALAANAQQTGDDSELDKLIEDI